MEAMETSPDWKADDATEEEPEDQAVKARKEVGSISLKKRLTKCRLLLLPDCVFLVPDRETIFLTVSVKFYTLIEI